MTDRAGVATPGWTTSAAWFDYDNDGRLDLFVCSFVDYTGVRKLECGNNQLGRNYYCVPRVFKPTASFLYHNNGDGTFAVGDYDNDGALDVIIGVNGGPLYSLRGQQLAGIETSGCHLQP